MTGRRPRTPPFSISSDVEHRVFAMLGRLDEQTLPLAGSVHLRMAPMDSPVRYLLDGYPLRPELREPSRQGERLAYSVGILAGAVALQGQLRASMPQENIIHMPPDPSEDTGVARVRSLAAGSRFWLQPFFETHSDVLAELLREVEDPLVRHHVDLGSRTEDGDHYVAIGAGDILALCAVVLDGNAQPGTLPLLTT